ncbi:MAG: hypothetical protein WA994_11870 [Ornithinimicrobium sp.]
MLEVGYPRDLAMIGAIFGMATFVWAGWAQEAPPRHRSWRLVLALLGLSGIALMFLSVPMAVRHWATATALQSGSVALTIYIVAFWVEIVVAGGLAFLAHRTGRSDLIAPLVLAVVGVHFIALAPVFDQPVLYLAAVLLTAIAIVAASMPRGRVARSFWCGLISSPVFLGIGVWSAVAASDAFARL